MIGKISVALFMSFNKRTLAGRCFSSLRGRTTRNLTVKEYKIPFPSAFEKRHVPFVQLFSGQQRNFQVSHFVASSGSFEGKSLQELLTAIDETSYKLLYVTLDEKEKEVLSALYMQATVGKCNEPEPHPLMKRYETELKYWKDWNKLGSMSQEDAAKKYLQIASKHVQPGSPSGGSCGSTANKGGCTGGKVVINT